MLQKRKRQAIIDWFNCMIILDSPLESLQQLSDGHHFIKLIRLISDSSSEEEELRNEAEIFQFIEKFLSRYFHTQIEALVNIPACLQGDEFELAKVSILLLSAAVQRSLSVGDSFLSSLTQLEEAIQVDIRDCIEAIILPDAGRLSSEFSGVLSRGNPDSPYRQTPRRSKRRSAALSPTSPLVTFIHSPMFKQQAAIKNLESKVALLQRELNEEESKGTNLEEENESLKKSLKDSGKEIKDLKEKIAEICAAGESAEELTDKYKSDIESLKQQLREFQNCELELVKLKNENVQLLNFKNDHESQKLEFDEMRSRLQAITSELHQAQTTAESQKDVIEEIHIENNNLKSQIESREKEIKIVQSLYHDAMEQVQKFQSSPVLPKGESLQVVTEMKLAEKEEEIKTFKESELQLKNDLESIMLCNENLKKTIASTEENKAKLEAELFEMNCKLRFSSEKEKNAEAQNRALSHELDKIRVKFNETEKELKSVLECKEKEMHELKLTVNVFDQENSLLKEKLKILTNEIECVKQEGEQKLKAVAVEMEDRRNQEKYLRHEIDVHKDSITKLKEELSEENSKLKSCCEKVKHDQNSLNQAKLEKDRLMHELEVMRIKAIETENDLNAIIKCKEDEAKGHYSDISLLKETNDHLHTKFHELQKENDHLKAVHESTEREIDNLKSDIMASNEEKSLLKEKLQNLENEIDCVKQAGEQKFSAQTAEMEDEMNRFKCLFEEYEDTKTKLEEELSEVNSKLKSGHEKEKQDQNSLHQAKLERDKLMHELEIMSAKATETENYLNSIIKCKEDEAKSHNSDVKLLKETNSHLRTKFHELKEENSHLHRTIENLNKQFTQQCAESEEKPKTELSDEKSKLCEKDNHDGDSLYQVILQKNALVEDLKSCQTRYCELELKFSKHLEVCENNKVTEGLRGALDKLTTENLHLQGQLDVSKAECQHLSNKLADTEQNLTTVIAQEREKQIYIEELCKQKQQFHDAQNQKDKKHDDEIKQLQDLLQNIKEEGKSAEMKHLMKIKNLEHCIEEKNEYVNQLNEKIQEVKETTENKDYELMTIKNSLQEVQVSHSELFNEMSQLKLEKVKCEEIISQFQQNSKEADVLQNYIGELKNENEYLLLRIDNFNSEKSELINQKKEMEQRMTSLTEENRQKNDNIDKLSEHIKNLETQIQDSVVVRAEMKRLQDLLHDIQNEKEVLVSKYSSEAQNLNRLIEEKDGVLLKAFKDTEELKEALKMKDDEIRTLQSTLHETAQLLHDIPHKSWITIGSEAICEEKLSQSNKDFQTSAENSSSENLKSMKPFEEAKVHLIQLAKEKQESDESVMKLSKEVKELQETVNQKDINHEMEIKKFEDLLHKSLQENEEMKLQYLAEVNNLNQYIQGSEEHCDKLRDAVKAQEKQIEQGNAKIQETEKELKKKEAEQSLLLSEKSSIQEELTRNNDVIVHLEAEITRINRYYREREEETDRIQRDMKNEIEALQKEIISRNDEIRELCLDLERLKEENQHLQHQIEGLQNQTTEDKLDKMKLKEELSVINTKMQDICENRVYQDNQAAVDTDALTKQLSESQALYESTKQTHLEHLKTCSEKDEIIKSLSVSLQRLVDERDDFQKRTESLDVSKQELMEKLEDTERRLDNLIKQKEIAESDFSRCVEKRDTDIEKLHKQIQELEDKQNLLCERHQIELKEVQHSLQESKSTESKLLIEVQNLKKCLQQKETVIRNNLEKVHQLEVVIKQKDVSLLKIKKSAQEAETARQKLITEISCLTEEKKIDKEIINRLTKENKKIPTYQQQQKKMLDELIEVRKTLDDYNIKNDQKAESFKKTVAKLQKEKAELEKQVLSLKQKVIGYQNVSENYKQALDEERRSLKRAKKELDESQKSTSDLRKRVALLENATQNYKERISCLENESRRARSELNEIKKYDPDDYHPAGRRFSVYLCTPTKTTDSPAENLTPSPFVWKKPAIKKRPSTASCISIGNETRNTLLDTTPVKTGASNLFLPLADEEDFLNYSSLAELKSGPPSISKSTKRLSELQRRNTLCPPHMQSSYPVETQMRPVTEFSDESFRRGRALENSKQNTLAEPLIKSHKISPKRKRSDSDERAEKSKKVSKSTEMWQSFKASIASPRSDAPRTPSAFKNVFAVNRKRNLYIHKKVKGK